MGGLAFLAALFGGSYWASKYSKDKSSMKNAQNEYEQIRAEDDALRLSWESSVINRDLEAELSEKIVNKDTDIISELSDTWCEYYSYPLPDLFLSNDFKGRLLDTDPSYFRKLTVLRIILANRGFLTEYDAKYGIDIFAGGDTKSEKEANFKIQEDFIKRINQKLCSRGICQKMYFFGINNLYYPFPGSYNIFSGSVFEAGKIIWRPSIYSSALKFSDNILNESYYLK